MPEFEETLVYCAPKRQIAHICLLKVLQASQTFYRLSHQTILWPSRTEDFLLLNIYSIEMPSVLQNNAGCFYEMRHKKQKERSLLSERSCDFPSQRKSLGRHLSEHREFQIHSALAKLRPFYSQWVYVKLHCRPLVWMLSLCSAQKSRHDCRQLLMHR